MITLIPNNYEMFKDIYLTFDSVEEILSSDGSNERNLAGLYSVYYAAQFGCKIVATFESVDEIVKCDELNESY